MYHQFPSWRQQLGNDIILKLNLLKDFSPVSLRAATITFAPRLANIGDKDTGI
ncbi:MAG: hypothetical protein KME30_01385 [Iphinoe sp. HA4291-MV1]|nr:hypothetical protein [Iphinoe sp. HA4291-MV1]